MIIWKTERKIPWKRIFLYFFCGKIYSTGWKGKSQLNCFWWPSGGDGWNQLVATKICDLRTHGTFDLPFPQIQVIYRPLCCIHELLCLGSFSHKYPTNNKVVPEKCVGALTPVCDLQTSWLHSFEILNACHCSGSIACCCMQRTLIFL